MQQFRGTPYGEDRYPEKRELTLEDCQFLAELQRKMCCQDNQAMADPMYWVICDYKKIYGNNLSSSSGYAIRIENYGSYQILYESSNENEIIKEAKLILTDALNNEPEDWFIEIPAITDIEAISTINDLRDFYENVCQNINISLSEYAEYIVEDHIFFSHEDAESYLKKFHYHFSDRAYVYGKVSLYNDEMIRLMDILHHADISRIISKL